MLQKLNFKPGFNKMVTESGAESQWVDGDNVRFRYGLPEKIGGWNQLTAASLTLPGDFAFQDFSNNSMVPENPSVINSRREARTILGKVTVSIS